MPEIRYDDRSFLLDDERIWLISGSIHYFRVPSELWADRLLKAKRAGLNCISTYIAWNFHELQQGQWDFSGDRDVVRFIELAGELGLYVILRPGPYICAEWDFGGLPAWLTTRSGIAYRTNNAAYMHYFDKYFANILPRLAEHQVTRGGNIVLIQNENEYASTTMPERIAYLDFISQLIRRSGFDIPIINCNLFSDPPPADSIECVNGYKRCVQQLKQLRSRQPDAPLVVTEFWCGWFDRWGGNHEVRDDRQVARKALEILGCGAQLNYYMWHGGTNFGFWGSRLVSCDAAYQTTSYDYDAPLAEGGGLTRKYYLTRLVNMLANHMGPFFASCKAEPPGVRIHDGTDVLNLSGPMGGWAVVTNGGRSEVNTATVSLPDGREIQVPLEPLGAVALPIGLKLGPDCVLDYANCMPLGLFGQNNLVLHGPAGWQAQLSINSKPFTACIPEGDEPNIVELPSVRVLLINSDTAMRTWFVDDELIFGPRFVGHSGEEVLGLPAGGRYTVLDGDGQLRQKKAKPTAAKQSSVPRLGKWSRISVCCEVEDKTDAQFVKIDRPRTLDALGVHYGYGWYRIEWTEKRARIRHLFFPECEDRATLFLNGTRLGVWGRGADATRKPIRAPVRRGTNVLSLLVDNMGRSNYGPKLGEQKGLFGHFYDATAIKPKSTRFKQVQTFSKRIVPRVLTQYLSRLEELPVWEADLQFSLNRVQPIHVSFAGLKHHVAVLCNDRAVGFFPLAGASAKNWGDVTLGAGLKKGKNTVKLILWGDADRSVLSQFAFHSLGEAVSQQGTWSFRPWQLPTADGPKTGRKNAPAWFSAGFAFKGGSDPLFLEIRGCKKGQIYLNGHNVGRFWTVGPQRYYYLPECWLDQKNELLLFEESGTAPRDCRLVFRSEGPYS